VSKLDTLGDVSALCEALEGAAATDGRWQTSLATSSNNGDDRPYP